MPRITSTELAEGVSGFLSRVEYGGETFEVIRRGRVSAVLVRPADAPPLTEPPPPPVREIAAPLATPPVRETFEEVEEPDGVDFGEMTNGIALSSDGRYATFDGRYFERVAEPPKGRASGKARGERV